MLLRNSSRIRRIMFDALNTAGGIEAVVRSVSILHVVSQTVGFVERVCVHSMKCITEHQCGGNRGRVNYGILQPRTCKRRG